MKDFTRRAAFFRISMMHVCDATTVAMPTIDGQTNTYSCFTGWTILHPPPTSGHAGGVMEL